MGRINKFLLGRINGFSEQTRDKVLMIFVSTGR